MTVGRKGMRGSDARKDRERNQGKPGENRINERKSENKRWNGMERRCRREETKWNEKGEKIGGKKGCQVYKN